ncbi:MAG: FecR domain-containing protein [Oscillospiraceae bacterium]
MKKMMVNIGATVLFSLALALPAFATDKAQAKSIRLVATEGDGVTVQTNAGKDVAISENMRVFTGYTLATDQNSYAYLSLDDKKAVKMDKSTKAEIKKQGKKNKLYVSSGQVFFNVKQKLTPDESMEIVTPNMTMSIRGTSGSVVLQKTVAEDGSMIEIHVNVQLYDGSSTTQVTDPRTGQESQIQVPAGKQLDIIDFTGTHIGDVILSDLKAEDIPSDAAQEILKDDVLSKRVQTDSGITADALKKAIQAAAAKEAAQDALEEQCELNAKKKADAAKNLHHADKVDTRPTDDDDDIDDDDDDFHSIIAKPSDTPHADKIKEDKAEADLGDKVHTSDADDDDTDDDEPAINKSKPPTAATKPAEKPKAPDDKVTSPDKPEDTDEDAPDDDGEDIDDDDETVKNDAKSAIDASK